MRRKDYYTKRQIAIAWVKKKLGIVSPSAFYVSDGKYKYAYDYMMKKKGGRSMSNAKKCDRCGKLYEFYKGVKLIPKGNAYICIDFVSGGNCGGIGVSKRFDLCKECMTELVKWMNDGKEGDQDVG